MLPTFSDDNTGTSIFYFTKVSDNTSTSLWDTTSWTDFLQSVEDLGKIMQEFQGFRAANLYWFNYLKRGTARRLSLLVWKSNRDEQMKYLRYLRTEDKKPTFKPKATSCRKWTTGKPRK